MTPLSQLPARSVSGPPTLDREAPPALLAPGPAGHPSSTEQQAHAAEAEVSACGSPASADGLALQPAATAEPMPEAPLPRPRRRARRRELHCPLHPEQKIFSVSPKHHLYVTDVGQLMLRGLSKRRADELLAAYRRVLPLTNEWIECFWCDDCASTTWWHVRRHDRHDYSLSKVPRELWEQATGVIRAEGNPTVSQFSRRQARASGVHGMRQYHFL